MKKSVQIATIATALLLIGAGCSLWQDTNTSVNTNTDDVTNVEDTNTTNEINTSDWLTYTNEEYGFSFRYPRSWSVNKYSINHLSVLTSNITDLPTKEKPAPKSSASPVTQAQNKTEQLSLLALEESNYGGKLIQTSYANFYRYNAVVENKSLVTEYVTYMDDVKITLRYLEDPSIQNASSDGLDVTLLNIVQTFQD